MEVFSSKIYLNGDNLLKELIAWSEDCCLHGRYKIVAHCQWVASV